MIEQESPHLLLGRIRFILDCIACFKAGKPLPLALCYVPAEVQYKICKDSSSSTATSVSSSAFRGTLLAVYAAPTDNKQNQKKLSMGSIEVKKGGCIRASGEEYCNSYGLWVKLNKKQLEEFAVGCDLNQGWILLCKNAEGGDRLVPVDSPDRTQRQQLLFGIDYKPVSSWEQVVDLSYALRLGAKPSAVAQDDDAVEKLRFVPHSWSYECDEDLVHFFSDHILKEDENLGRIKQYVDSIDVSSFMEESNVWCLTDNYTETYWESDGSQGQHWIRLHMKKGTIVKKLILTVNATDDNYMPKRVVVYGGKAENLKKLSEVPIDE